MSKICQDFPCLAKYCLAFFWGDAKSLAWPFLARRVLPFVFVFFYLFWGGDAKSLAWVFLARRVLPFVLGVFFGLFWGAMPNPSLGCFLLVGCYLSCWGSFLAFFGGDAKSLAWVFLARRVLTKWMVMGSIYLELFEIKPCCILVCPVIPYALYNTIL